MKLCKDCRHFLILESGKTYCGRDDRRSFIWGTRVGPHCEDERSTTGECGPDAKYFETGSPSAMETYFPQ